MARILLLLVAVVLGLAWATRRRDSGPTVGTPKRPEAPRLQAMVRCAHCQLHLPAAEALQDAEGRWYCCEAHRRQGAAP
ncbi:hypothetical protein KGA65_20165 [Ideonella sp. B7]|uniref:PP0621 family protein n=1 Tax=Ideonella benzenivorans TaxID=2831643 RepID=UPI001CEC6CB8|nr:PP0621 family protein [Ideonella benzenivorans]MCA6218864.1 hypothetical protein [Ideonella benzenivorans]